MSMVGTCGRRLGLSRRSNRLRQRIVTFNMWNRTNMEDTLVFLGHMPVSYHNLNKPYTSPLVIHNLYHPPHRFRYRNAWILAYQQPREWFVLLGDQSFC